MDADRYVEPHEKMIVLIISLCVPVSLIDYKENEVSEKNLSVR